MPRSGACIRGTACGFAPAPPRDQPPSPDPASTPSSRRLWAMAISCSRTDSLSNASFAA